MASCGLASLTTSSPYACVCPNSCLFRRTPVMWYESPSSLTLTNYVIIGTLFPNWATFWGPRGEELNVFLSGREKQFNPQVQISLPLPALAIYSLWLRNDFSDQMHGDAITDSPSRTGLLGSLCSTQRPSKRQMWRKQVVGLSNAVLASPVPTHTPILLAGERVFISPRPESCPVNFLF